MPKIIHHVVEFRTAPEALFDMYMNSKKHAPAVGAPASISRRVGGRFWVFGKDAVRGRNLLIMPQRLIVQAWRAQPWKDSDLDSILTLAFSKSKNGARVEPVQALVPDHAFRVINHGWHAQYWEPWRTYLKQEAT